MKDQNLWKYNFVVSDWEEFTTCAYDKVATLLATITAAFPNMCVIASDEKPAMKVSFV